MDTLSEEEKAVFFQFIQDHTNDTLKQYALPKDHPEYESISTRCFFLPSEEEQKYVYYTMDPIKNRIVRLYDFSNATDEEKIQVFRKWMEKAQEWIESDTYQSMLKGELDMMPGGRRKLEKCFLLPETEIGTQAARYVFDDTMSIQRKYILPKANDQYIFSPTGRVLAEREDVSDISDEEVQAFLDTNTDLKQYEITDLIQKMQAAACFLSETPLTIDLVYYARDPITNGIVRRYDLSYFDFNAKKQIFKSIKQRMDEWVKSDTYKAMTDQHPFIASRCFADKEVSELGNQYVYYNLNDKGEMIRKYRLPKPSDQYRYTPTGRIIDEITPSTAPPVIETPMIPLESVPSQYEMVAKTPSYEEPVKSSDPVVVADVPIIQKTPSYEEPVKSSDPVVVADVPVVPKTPSYEEPVKSSDPVVVADVPIIQKTPSYEEPVKSSDPVVVADVPVVPKTPSYEEPVKSSDPVVVADVPVVPKTPELPMNAPVQYVASKIASYIQSIKIPTPPKPTPSKPESTLKKVYDFQNIQHQGSRKCLDGDGSKIYFNACKKSDRQTWKLNTHHQLEHKQSKKCIESKGDKTYFASCNKNNKNQQWDYTNGRLIHRPSNQCLESDGKTVYYKKDCASRKADDTSLLWNMKAKGEKFRNMDPLHSYVNYG